MAGKSVQDKALPVMVIALIGAAFALGMMWGKVQVYEKGGSPSGPLNAKEQAQQPEEPTVLEGDALENLLVDPAYAFGDENAPVTLVEFTDFECPFCKRYTDETFVQIVENYVDTGKVRYIMRDLPLSFHPNAKPAALAARCAGDQGKYKEMHSLLFENQDKWSVGDSGEKFASYAVELGLNTTDFSSCVESDKFAEAIDADLELAAKVGASGTPSFFVNGTSLVGAQPYAAFEKLIEESL
ncbi:DsbA family protein [Patescibacteria group bacterium]